LRNAAVVSCVSDPLSDLVKNTYGARGHVLTLPSTIDKSIFNPRTREDCRQRLKLPVVARLIGTAGGLSREKGIEPLYLAFESLARDDPNLHLVLAGPVDPACPPPDSPRVHYLGMLPHASTADLFSALDVGVVYIRDTPYGRFSFPQKAYEMAACGIPMAVARVGAMTGLFGATPQVFYEPDDAISLTSCLKAQLDNPVKTDFPIPDWAELAIDMESAYLAIIGN